MKAYLVTIGIWQYKVRAGGVGTAINRAMKWERRRRIQAGEQTLEALASGGLVRASATLDLTEEKKT